MTMAMSASAGSLAGALGEKLRGKPSIAKNCYIN